MSEAIKVAEISTKPLFDQAVWSSIPSILWAILVLISVVLLKSELRQLLLALIMRLKSGAAIRFAGLEMSGSSALKADPGSFSHQDSRIGVFPDDGVRTEERDEIYKECRGVMLTHRLQRSIDEGQLYDILIYVIPHKSSSFAGVSSVEYFLGNHWGNKVFPSVDRSRGFPIVTSAYGSFLCTAKVKFNDGNYVTLSRYIDFEMSNYIAQ